MAQGIPSATVRRLLLQLPKRRRLFEAIVARPGLHARRLSRQLDMALGVVEHHARQLEKHGLIFCQLGGRRRTFFASGQVDVADARLIHALRKDEWGPIMAALSIQGPCAVVGLATWLGEPASTVGYHLRRLKDAGLVENVRLGRDSYYVLPEAERVEALMQQLHPEAKNGVPDTSFAGLVARAEPVTPPVGPAALTMVAPYSRKD